MGCHQYFQGNSPQLFLFSRLRLRGPGGATENAGVVASHIESLAMGACVTCDMESGTQSRSSGTVCTLEETRSAQNDDGQDRKRLHGERFEAPFNFGSMKRR